MNLVGDLPILSTGRRIASWCCLLLASACVIAVPVGAAGDHGSSCETATTVAPNGHLTAYHDFFGDQDYFRIEPVSEGLLVLELAGPSGLRLELVGMGCAGGTDDVGFIERSDLRDVIEIRTPGAYFVKVVGSSANAPSYELSTTFLPVTPWVEEIVLAGGAGGSCTAAGEDESIVFESGGQMALSEDTDEIDSDVIIIRSTLAGFLEVEAEGAQVLGSLYADRSCAPEVQLLGDVGLSTGEKILLEVPAGEYFLRLSPGPGTGGAYNLRIAYYTMDGT